MSVLFRIRRHKSGELPSSYMRLSRMVYNESPEEQRGDSVIVVLNTARWSGLMATTLYIEANVRSNHWLRITSGGSLSSLGGIAGGGNANALTCLTTLMDYAKKNSNKFSAADLANIGSLMSKVKGG
ncbi:hypothetical protein CRM22_003268 [Opisthorchis felineus]|uniref:Uncharacterized protein n=1 Tax=Opisthorchis felineus TaxID=147828 RepID=A0A4S2M885_OPIFE|nr:hypothetical protein CRM22_003268 [Opisthorchis felineus]